MTWVDLVESIRQAGGTPDLQLLEKTLTEAQQEVEKQRDLALSYAAKAEKYDLELNQSLQRISEKQATIDPEGLSKVVDLQDKVLRLEQSIATTKAEEAQQNSEISGLRKAKMDLTLVSKSLSNSAMLADAQAGDMEEESKELMAELSGLVPDGSDAAAVLRLIQSLPEGMSLEQYKQILEVQSGEMQMEILELKRTLVDDQQQADDFTHEISVLLKQLKKVSRERAQDNMMSVFFDE